MKGRVNDMLKDYVRDGKIIVATLEDGRVAKMSSAFIDNMIKNLQIDEYEAVMTWLEDEEYIINDEQVELEVKGKENKVLASLHRTKGERKQSTEKRTRTVKENPTKEAIIATIAAAIEGLEGASDVVIENKGKIITFAMAGENFKIDLVQKRKSKETN